MGLVRTPFAESRAICVILQHGADVGNEGGELLPWVLDCECPLAYLDVAGHLLDECLGDELLLAPGKVPVQGADTDAGGPGVLERHVDATLGIQRLGGR